MSQNAAKSARPNLPAVIGNTVRALPGLDTAWAPEQEAVPERRRTPLSVVPAGPARRRVPFTVLCCLALVAALATVLVLNIWVSTGQYDLVKLRNEQLSLAQENQSLTQQVENHLAPQNLAAKAAELGMVAAPSSGSIDLNTLKVTGDPKPADAGAKPSALVAAPDVADPTAANAAPNQAGTRSPGTAAPAPGAPAPGTPAAGNGSAPADLNGGTIPAPMQQTGR